MILTIDAGNSRTKWGIFNVKHALVAHGVFVNDEYPLAPPAAWTICTGVIVSCVAGNLIAQKIKTLTDTLGVSARFIQSTAHACGVENGYDNPAQLGTDRWAAMIAAWQQLKAPCVVVNAGTAITVDAIAAQPAKLGLGKLDEQKQGLFMGGLILPGLQLMQNSLLDNTAQIQPAAKHHDFAFQSFPTNTASAVHSGALTAILGLIKAMMIQLQENRKEPIFCLLSGGDATVFAEALNAYPAIQLAAPASVDAHLVLKGLLYLYCESTQMVGQHNV